MDVDETVCETLTVQDDPLPAVMVVPAVTPVPEMTMPMAIVPVGVEVVKVVVDMEPVKVAVEPVVTPV